MVVVPPVTPFALGCVRPLTSLAPGTGTPQGAVHCCLEHAGQILAHAPGSPGGTGVQASARGAGRLGREAGAWKRCLMSRSTGSGCAALISARRAWRRRSGCRRTGIGRAAWRGPAVSRPPGGGCWSWRTGCAAGRCPPLSWRQRGITGSRGAGVRTGRCPPGQEPARPARAGHHRLAVAGMLLRARQRLPLLRGHPGVPDHPAAHPAAPGPDRRAHPGQAARGKGYSKTRRSSCRPCALTCTG